MVDALDSKSGIRKDVGVRVPPCPPITRFLHRVVLIVRVPPCHDKNHSDFFATPPQSVTFVIRLPALRTAAGSSHPPITNFYSKSGVRKPATDALVALLLQ